MEEPQSWATGDQKHELTAGAAGDSVPMRQPLCFTGSAVGGRPLLRISGVRPSAVEQSASEAAELQLGEHKIRIIVHFLVFKRKRDAYLSLRSDQSPPGGARGSSICACSVGGNATLTVWIEWNVKWFIGWGFAGAAQTVAFLFSPDS